MATMATPETLLPPDDPVQLESLAQALPTLPPSLRTGFEALVQALSRGEAVRVEPVSPMLTTGQAADILNVSRTTFVKLLEEGRIPYTQPSVHRQVRLEDVLEYKRERSAMRTTFLKESLRQAKEDGLLEEDLDDYITVLREVRSGTHVQ
ncbi:MAG: helix-turn-helix domain-containing protein [Micrococcales bacterium]|nr:helix-turn-helix domain-containing protein [Micrococcales bacterium]